MVYVWIVANLLTCKYCFTIFVHSSADIGQIMGKKKPRPEFWEAKQKKT
jgi:hypothetical protein